MVSVKLVADGIRGCGLMVRFMIATFTDLIFARGHCRRAQRHRAGLHRHLDGMACGLVHRYGASMVFYVTAIRKALAEPLAAAEAEGQAAEVRAEAEFAADAEMETL